MAVRYIKPSEKVENHGNSQNRKNDSVLSNTIRTLVAQNGLEIFDNISALTEQLEEDGVHPLQAKQVELVLKASSFCDYVKQIDEGISAIDINNIILTAQKSGLTIARIRKTVSELLYGIGIMESCTQKEFEKNAADDKKINTPNIFIAPQVYETQLAAIGTKIENRSELDSEQYSFLNYCYIAGVPAAARLLGQIYMDGIGVDRDVQKAMTFFQPAIEMGDVKAISLQGDCQYNLGNYNTAYGLYTAPGVYSLKGNRQRKVQIMRRVKEFNRKQMYLWAIAAVLVEFVMLALFAVSPVTGNHTTAKVVCSILNIAITAYLLWTNHKRPFSDLRGYGMLYAITVFLYSFAYIML